MEKLKEYGLRVIESDNPNRDVIDFSIEDGEDNVAWVWGHNAKDLDWECNHPSQCYKFDDNETVGECLLCGSYCDWHEEIADDEGHTCRVPHEWYPRNVGGMIKEYIEETLK